MVGCKQLWMGAASCGASGCARIVRKKWGAAYNPCAKRLLSVRIVRGRRTTAYNPCATGPVSVRIIRSCWKLRTIRTRTKGVGCEGALQSEGVGAVGHEAACMGRYGTQGTLYPLHPAHGLRQLNRRLCTRVALELRLEHGPARRHLGHSAPPRAHSRTQTRTHSTRRATGRRLTNAHGPAHHRRAPLAAAHRRRPDRSPPTHARRGD